MVLLATTAALAADVASAPRATTTRAGAGSTEPARACIDRLHDAAARQAQKSHAEVDEGNLDHSSFLLSEWVILEDQVLL